MNTTILDYPIFYVTYISQVPSNSPIDDQIPLDTGQNIYVVSIENQDPSLAATAFQMLRDKWTR